MVFLGLTGTMASGKRTLAEMLVNVHGFRLESLPEVVERQSEEDITQAAKKCLKILMKTWMENWVVVGFIHPAQIRVFRRRVYFYLLGLDGPFQHRFILHCVKHGEVSPEDFAVCDYHSRYAPGSLQDCILLADERVINSGSMESFQSRLRAINVAAIQKVRPTWDEYLMSIAVALSSRSSCLIRRSGSVIGVDNIVVGTGYISAPFRVPDCYEQNGCSACHQIRESADDCSCLHSELSALLSSCDKPVHNATLYCTDFPCLYCMKHIAQAKIKRIVYLNDHSSLRFFYSLSCNEYREAKELARAAGIDLSALSS